MVFIWKCYDLLKRRLFLILWISLISGIFYETFICYKEERQFFYLRQILGSELYLIPFSLHKLVSYMSNEANMLHTSVNTMINTDENTDGPQYLLMEFGHTLDIGLCISRGTATVLNLCSALVLLPLCKKLNQILYRILSRVWPRLFFCWLENAKSFHMTVAITLFVVAVIHSISHFVNLWNFCRNYDELRPDINLATHKDENPFRLLLSQPGLTGLAMLTITTTMCITSLRIVRRKMYNAFWYTHQLYLPFVLLLIIHPLSGVLKQEVIDEKKPNIYSSQMDNDTPRFVSIKSTTWLWMAIPLSCYFIDLIWRIAMRNRSNAGISKVSLMAGRVLNVTLACPHDSFKCRPGQYVLLQCPDISLLEWHPFTVVKVPTVNERYFVVWIKVTGDWTEALENLLLERCNTVRILVDGPMASVMERVETCRVALCVAAGVGITPFVPILHKMLSAPRNPRPGRVHLIWIVRTEGEAAALADLSSQCLQQLREANRPDRLHLLIHITGSAENGSNHCAKTQTMVNEKGVTYVVNSESDAKITLLNENSKETDNCKTRYQIASDYPLVGCRMTQGRPHWDRVFGYWVHLYPKEHLTLFCCGPKKLVNTLRTKCKEVSHSTKTKFEFVHEKFS